MNLLQDRWIPVRRQDGAFDWIAPYQITETENPVIALDAARPDFNGALTQFLIGLLQTACPPSTDTGWEQQLNNPPTPSQLQAAFKPLLSAFALNGDGPRFMQDLSLDSSEADPKDISGLLIEAPGAQSLERNTDHFVKRNGGSSFCPRCAAAALFTLHTNAPAGGAGHRTGLRGGGPLTTLLVDAQNPSVWRNAWLNVLTKEFALALHEGKELTAQYRIFPWCADQTSTQAAGDKNETQPGQTHPLHVYWAMPRRIRLDLSAPTTGDCTICGEASTQLISQYVTKNYGLNYKGAWRHPLTPYSKQKKPDDPALAIHPQPGGIGYKHWLGWVLGNNEGIIPATVIGKRGINDIGSLWAFGFDMDNMKARGWQEAILPLYALDERRICEAQTFIGQWVAAAQLSASQTRYALKMAFNSQPKEAKGDYNYASDALWQQTEAYFYMQLRDLMVLLNKDTDNDLDPDHINAFRKQWQQTLRNVALAVFDEHTGGDPLNGSLALRRNAHNYLKYFFNGNDFSRALGLELSKPEKSKKSPAKNKPTAKITTARNAPSEPVKEFSTAQIQNNLF